MIFPSYLEHMVKKSSNIETYAGNLLITNIDEKKAKIEKVNDANGKV